MSEEEYYDVEKILDRRKINGKYEYKIKWEGYPIDESTWEPLKNLKHAKELVDEYNSAHPFSEDKKSNKKGKSKKDDKFINKKQKRKKEIEEIEEIEVIEENNNQNKEIKKKCYKIDDSLKKVFTVKKLNQKLIAIVEKVDDNGVLNETTITTEELKKTNPWILINFYESKIIFT